MWRNTLVVVLSEFGRTPTINQFYGRDHWATAWSICLGGAKVHPGAVYGKTNANGTAVVDKQVDHANLFHTYLAAVGLDTTTSFDVAGRELMRLAGHFAAPGWNWIYPLPDGRGIVCGSGKAWLVGPPPGVEETQ